jgi:hypothetical protein
MTTTRFNTRIPWAVRGIVHAGRLLADSRVSRLD